MKRISIRLLAVLFSFVLYSCSAIMEQQDPFHQLEELTEDIRQHHDNYSTADWKDAYVSYERIAAEMEYYQYTEEECERIGRLEGECVGYFMKSAINSLGGIESEIKGFVDGINKTIEQ